MASSLLVKDREAHMKIDPNKIIGSVVPGAVRPSAGAGGAFENVLKGVETGAVAKPVNIQTPFQQFSVSPVKLSAVGASEEALELLVRYSRAVSDPQVSLKGLAPMVEELESMRTRVEGAASFISDDDPLKGIMKELSSSLYGEVLRFRRGDLIG
jgi:hypothetical protein